MKETIKRNQTRMQTVQSCPAESPSVLKFSVDAVPHIGQIRRSTVEPKVYCARAPSCHTAATVSKGEETKTDSGQGHIVDGFTNWISWHQIPSIKKSKVSRVHYTSVTCPKTRRW